MPSLDPRKMIHDLAVAHPVVFETLLQDLVAAVNDETVVFVEDSDKTLAHTFMREGKLRLLRDLRDKFFKMYDRRS